MRRDPRPRKQGRSLRLVRKSGRETGNRPEFGTLPVKREEECCMREMHLLQKRVTQNYRGDLTSGPSTAARINQVKEKKTEREGLGGKAKSNPDVEQEFYLERRLRTARFI
mmetsp:Transcript_37641/g.74013  ORF Transcript_37641/g.74013 Transcript_37641/m.74013 type:complete len:111 (+) Transcript_37641:1520-1852(+)